MSDLIRRQDAMALVDRHIVPTGNAFYDNAREDERASIKDDLASLPSADRPTGKWLKSDGTPYGKKPDGSCWCSKCGKWLVASDEYDVDDNFCPNCGAKMEV